MSAAVPQQTSAVLLDMDGIICESFPFLRRAITRLFQERYGIVVAKGEFAPYAGRGEASYVAGIAAAHGITADVERDALEIHARYKEEVRGQMEALPGVKSLIASCRAQLIPVALVTSSNRDKTATNLREIGIDPRSFDVLVTREDVTQAKPAPDLYERAARMIAMHPQDCLAVEDSPSGIRSAKSAGCLCLGVTNSFSADHLKAAGADWIVDTLEGLRLKDPPILPPHNKAPRSVPDACASIP